MVYVLVQASAFIITSEGLFKFNALFKLVSWLLLLLVFDGLKFCIKDCLRTI